LLIIVKTIELKKSYRIEVRFYDKKLKPKNRISNY